MPHFAALMLSVLFFLLTLGRSYPSQTDYPESNVSRSHGPVAQATRPNQIHGQETKCFRLYRTRYRKPAQLRLDAGQAINN